MALYITGTSSRPLVEAAENQLPNLSNHRKEEGFEFDLCEYYYFPPSFLKPEWLVLEMGTMTINRNPLNTLSAQSPAPISLRAAAPMGRGLILLWPVFHLYQEQEDS